MAGQLQILLQRLRKTVQGFVDEPALALQGQLSMLQRFVHFWIVVYRAFVRNRCPVHASSLSYTTLLALVPLLAVMLGVTSSLLKSEGERRIEQFIERMVITLIPEAPTATNSRPFAEFLGPPAPDASGTATQGHASVGSAPEAPPTNAPTLAGLIQANRKDAAKTINTFVQNTRSGTLGITGMIMLIFVVISLIVRIEETFNDIWGVTQGRTWFTKVILYWAAVTLGPLLLIAGIGLASGSQAEGIRVFISQMAFLGNLIFKVLPIFILWLAFSLFYLLMPATKVHWSAAAVGGLVGSLLWTGNNLIAFLYVSRVVGASKIYGSLGLVPVIMVGLYFSWFILLFGAQVSYAWQNRAIYLQERLAEHVNQRGREFIALRLMTAIGQRFQGGTRPATIPELSAALAVPSRLVQQIMQTMLNSGLVVEVAGRDVGYTPARPLETINCHQILQAMRATNGQELATRNEPVRAEVLGEFARIQEAERQAAATVTMLALVNRVQARLELATPEETRSLKAAQPIVPERGDEDGELANSTTGAPARPEASIPTASSGVETPLVAALPASEGPKTIDLGALTPPVPATEEPVPPPAPRRSVVPPDGAPPLD
jgi:membrane protein